ncbi:MAG: hypothetical protein EAX86_09515 [Candidatus Heimdallarchaeota archaeon]|nr:hypothetical protein [Candidatus Heimdallarchaeota archaeon]
MEDITLKQSTSEISRIALIRLGLVVLFFLTCIIVPVFKILPFLERTSGVLEQSPQTTFYFHDAIVNAVDWSFFGIGKVFVLFPGMIISLLVWMMPLFGLLTILIAFRVFFDEIRGIPSHLLCYYQKVAILTLGIIWIEWSAFLCLILGEEWGHMIPEVISLPPIPNTFLLSLTLFGTLALLGSTSTVPIKLDSLLKVFCISDSTNSKSTNQKNYYRKIIIEITLLCVFFLTCVLFPFLRVLPFLQSPLTSDYEGPTFFFDHYIQNGYKHPYVSAPFQPNLLTLFGIVGWFMVGLGLSTVILFLFSLYQNGKIHPSSFSVLFRCLSGVTLGFILFEWIMIFSATDNDWIIQKFGTSLQPDLLLFGLMVCGVISLIGINLIVDDSA